jgi:Rps23 Pro-64 3,4-dihydroxylase Tpa1-like proline 4-hydroxylase
MKKLTDILTTNVFEDEQEFKTAKPFPMKVIDNFLPENVAHSMFDEIQSVDKSLWKHFTRNGSNMYELNKMELTPLAFEVMGYLHSKNALDSLEKITGIKGLIPDPHLVGAGYSIAMPGDTLQPHTDFNWNDTLKLHRAMSLIIYLTPDWKPEWNGGLDFYDKTRTNVESHVDCLFNRCLIWQYNKFGWHGHINPLNCPEDKPRTTFRLFYYTSNSSYLEDDPPHRSQYWMDENGMPHDRRDHK